MLCKSNVCSILRSWPDLVSFSPVLPGAAGPGRYSPFSDFSGALAYILPGSNFSGAVYSPLRFSLLIVFLIFPGGNSPARFPGVFRQVKSFLILPISNNIIADNACFRAFMQVILLDIRNIGNYLQVTGK